MNKNAYKMTTVCKYLELLDNELRPAEKKIASAVERYIHNAGKAGVNAELLEKLMA